MQLSPFPCHLVPLRSKYSPQHPILKDPQPAFLPQCLLPILIVTNSSKIPTYVTVIVAHYWTNRSPIPHFALISSIFSLVRKYMEYFLKGWSARHTVITDATLLHGSEVYKIHLHELC